MLVAGLDLLDAAEFLAVDAPAGVLIADLGVEKTGPARVAFERLATDHRAFDVLEHLSVGLILVMVRVDVDDQEVLIVAGARLRAGVLQMLRR